MPSLTSAPAKTAVAKDSGIVKKPLVPQVTNGSTASHTTPQSKNVKVGVWNLNSTEFTELEAPENTESLFSGTAGESVLGEDSRKRVDKKDLMPGGKYRPIVKLFLRFARQDVNDPWAMATGWLISDDTLVTAGHCSYDWSHKLGKLTHVKAYIGYYGKESIKDRKNFAVQFRTGKRVATTQGWLAGGNNERHDVSFIQVNQPFTGIKPMKYQPTPTTGTKMILGVVGYPGDLMNSKSKEKGAFMYEMYDGTTFDVSKTKTKMLQYNIDTYGGNSGSPVIRKSDMASIGVHVLGGNPNSASVISGLYGNPFDAFVTALKGNRGGPPKNGEATVNGTGSHEDGEATVDGNGSHEDGETTVDGNGPHEDDEAVIDGTEADWLSWVTLPTKEHSSGGETNVAPQPGNGDLDHDDPEANVPSGQSDSESALDEGFFNFLKKAIGVVPGPFGMVAGLGMGVAGQLLAKKKKTEAATDESYSFEGVAERALLGEAALETIVQLGPSKCKDLGIFERMQPTVVKLRPICSRAGPMIMPFVMERAWRLTMAPEKLPQKEGEANIEPAHIATAADTNTSGFAPRLDPNAEAFVQKLTESLTTEVAESFAGTEFKIGEVVAKGLRVSGPILGSVTESGLSQLAGEGTEADANPDTEADINDPESSAYTYDAMTQRAIAGEAALGALLQTPMESLEQENWLSSMTGPLMKHGPKFLKALGPVGAVLSIASSAVSLANSSKKTKEVDTGLDPDSTHKEDEADIDDVESGGSAESNFLAMIERMR